MPQKDGGGFQSRFDEDRSGKLGGMKVGDELSLTVTVH